MTIASNASVNSNGARISWSGRRDLNPRPPVPKTGALTRLRHAPLSLTRAEPMGGRTDSHAAIGNQAVTGAVAEDPLLTLSPTRMFSRAVVPAASSSVARTGPRLSITARLSGTVFSAIERIVPSALMNTMSSDAIVLRIHICEVVRDAPVEQHAAVGRNARAEHQPDGLLIRRERHLHS